MVVVLKAVELEVLTARVVPNYCLDCFAFIRGIAWAYFVITASSEKAKVV
jgi:uncharacterized membrane protein YqaE (UPF0057 family)